MTYNKLQEAIKDAWEKVSSFIFKELIKSMLKRCQAIIDVNGLFTKY
jgi:hypothetical protein